MVDERRDWQAHPSYTHDREVGAVTELVEDANRVLFAGDHGAVLAAFMAASYDTAHLVTQADYDSPDGVDHHYHVSSYESLPDLTPYDAIITPWLDWPRRPDEAVKQFVDALADDGCLIVETPDESSQHAQVIQMLRQRTTGSMFMERLRLLEPLTTAGTVERYQVRTAYHFQTIDDFILYFNQKSNAEYGEKLSSDTKDELRELGEQLGFERLEERSVLLRVSP